MLLRAFATLLLLASAAHAAVTEIPSPAPPGAAEPFVLATPADGILLTWLEPAGGGKRTAMRIARLRDGKWSPAQTIAERDDLLANWADFPSIAQDDHGVLFAQLLTKGASGHAHDVRLTISRDGGKTWSTPQLLNRDGRNAEHGFASLQPLPGGGVAVAWLDGRNMPEGHEHGGEGEMMLRSAAVDANGKMTGERELDHRACECCGTGMAMAEGKAVLVYRDRSADNVRDVSVVRQTAGGWTAPKPLHADGWKINGCPLNGPRIDGAGKRLAAAWFTGAGERPHVYVAFSADGGATFDKPIAVDDGNPAGRVDVVLLGSDSTVVTWVEQTGTTAELRARRVSRAAAPGASICIGESGPARSTGFARMARAGGEVLVTWTESNDNGKRVRLARVTTP